MEKDGEYLEGYMKDGKVMSKDPGFGTSGGRERRTTGIHFWNKVFQIPNPSDPGKKMCVLLMDTQGLWDSKAGSKLNGSIFGLSCILSSFLIFNHFATLNAEHLKEMAALTDTFSKGLAKLQNKGKPFQHLEILNREFFGIDPDYDTRREGLEATRNWKKTIESDDAFKESTKKLENCFGIFDVMCLPYPGNIKSPKYDGNITKMNKLFKCMLGHYIEDIISKIEPRRIAGKTITGKDFIKYAKEYGGIFRSTDDFPDSSLIMDVTSDISNSKLIEDYSHV